MKRKHSSIHRLIGKLTILCIGIGFCLMLGIYGFSFLLGPPPLESEQNTIFYSNNGEVIGEERGLENREWLELSEIPQHVIDATLVIEDKRFYDHIGFDFKRIAGAALKDIRHLSLSEGASTITQQLARNLYLTHEKTWERKIKEAFYTVRLEMYYSKAEILEAYLNTIYFGHGAYGIEAASTYFFDKSAKDLTLAEATMLVGIPKGPTYYSPLNDQENAEQRQQMILHQLVTNGYITNPSYQNALSEQLAYSQRKKQEQQNNGAYFQDLALREAAAILDMNLENIRSGGYAIHTTLDKELQNEFEKTIKAHIPESTELQIGAMSIDPKSGAILSMVGGRDYSKSAFNRAVDARRMAGSTFKPFLYYAALETGYTPTTMLTSKPTVFELEDGNVYQPSNFNDYYAYEQITLAQALALSDNIYAVKTNLFLQENKLVDTAKQFGISGELPAVPSLALGTASVTLKDMVSAYGMLANGGHEVDSYTIEKIVDRNGKTVYQKENKQGKQILDPSTTYILTDLMTGMFDTKLNGYTSVTGASIHDELTNIYAGKSGTTNSDSWMIGFSPSLVTGIWTGYDDNRNIQIVKEMGYAKQIWAEVMEKAHEELPNESFAAPKDVVGIPIDPQTGGRSTPYCESSRIMYFKKGTEPQTYCSEHYHGEEKENGKKVEQEKDRGFFKEIFDSLF